MKFHLIAIAAAVGLLVLLGILGIPLAVLLWIPLKGFHESLGVDSEGFRASIGVYSELASIVSDIIVALVAAIGALLGFGEWKRRFNAKQEHELARRVLRAVYLLRNEIHAYRCLLVPGYEASVAFQLLKNEGVNIEGIGATYAAYAVRRQRLARAVVELEGEQIEIRVIWGEEAVKSLDLIFKLAQKLHLAHESYFSGCYNSSDPGDRECLAKKEKLIKGDPTDKFGVQVDKAVVDIENWLGPKLPRSRP